MKNFAFGQKTSKLDSISHDCQDEYSTERKLVTEGVVYDLFLY